METAAILCEGAFAKGPGKTAAGLVRKSRRFKIVGVIDSTSPSGDAGEILDGIRRDIPVFSSINEMLDSLGDHPDYLIIGVATIGGMLPKSFRGTILASLEMGMGVISGLHERLSDDDEFKSVAERSGATIIDIRKERPLNELHPFRNLVKDIPCIRIPVLGTDAAIGKRTTALELTDALNALGIDATFIATGQTGLLQGSAYGVPIDAIRGDYVVGELENAIMRAFNIEQPEVIIIEGQGSLSHPVYVTGSRAIISASSPNGVILQHAPKRRHRTFHDEEFHLPMDTLPSEIELVRYIAKCPLLGITINHSGMTEEEVQEIMAAYQNRYGVPCTDVLWFGADSIAKEIAIRFDLLK